MTYLSHTYPWRKLIFILLLIISTSVEAQAPAQCDTIYAVHDQGRDNSQFFTYHLTQHTLAPLGQLYPHYDLEGLSVHPITHLLYASTGTLQSKLYQVDGKTGELEKVGPIGFDNVVGLAFHPDGGLWGRSDQGLIQIDTHTGAGTLIPTMTLPIQDLAWDQEVLYAVAKDTSNHSTLWQWSNYTWEVVCQGLPKKTEGLAIRPDGLLVYGFHENSQLSINTYDMTTCQTIAIDRIDTRPYSDIEGIAWSTHACSSSNQDLLKAHLKRLAGVTDVTITEEGAISLTINGELHRAQLDKQLTPGVPLPDALLTLTSVADKNGDGIGDFEVVYPNGDRQMIYYFGIAEEACPSPPTEITPLSAFASSLYTGGINPLQKGITSTTIDLGEVAILQGKVMTEGGKPVPNVTISVLNHPEFGQTLTTCEGSFHLAVNAGEEMVVQYHKAGHLPLQRKVTPSKQTFDQADDVVMTAMESQSNHVNLQANVPMQVVQSQRVTDSRGSRQATVLFPQETTATLIFPGGNTQVLNELDLHITEYTVEPALVAKQFPDTYYTYVIEFTVDQAQEASHVQFNQPLPVYVENFTQLPVGGALRTGGYDLTQAKWISSIDGRVLKLLSVEGETAMLDIEGQGSPATEDSLKSLGITIEERRQLAKLYSVGQTLWRIPVTHFSAWGARYYTPNPVGFLDVANENMIAGWTCDHDRPNDSIPVHVYFYDKNNTEIVVLPTQTDQFSEPAVNTACGGEGNHRFVYSLTPSLLETLRQREGPYTVKVLGINAVGTEGQDAVLYGGLKQIGYAPIGVLDVADKNKIAGWACDRNRPNDPISVHVDLYDENEEIFDSFSIQADQPSEKEVNTLCMGGNTHRFEYFPTPTLLEKIRQHNGVFSAKIWAEGALTQVEGTLRNYQQVLLKFICGDVNSEETTDGSADLWFAPPWWLENHPGYLLENTEKLIRELKEYRVSTYKLWAQHLSSMGPTKGTFYYCPPGSDCNPDDKAVKAAEALCRLRKNKIKVALEIVDISLSSLWRIADKFCGPDSNQQTLNEATNEAINGGKEFGEKLAKTPWANILDIITLDDPMLKLHDYIVSKGATPDELNEAKNVIPSLVLASIEGFKIGFGREIKFIYLTNFPNWYYRPDTISTEDLDGEYCGSSQPEKCKTNISYRWDFRDLVNQLLSKAQSKNLLQGVQVDSPFNYTVTDEPSTEKSLERLLDLATLTKKKGLQFQFIVNSDVGHYKEDEDVETTRKEVLNGKLNYDGSGEYGPGHGVRSQKELDKVFRDESLVLTDILRFNEKYSMGHLIDSYIVQSWHVAPETYEDMLDITQAVSKMLNREICSFQEYLAQRPDVAKEPRYLQNPVLHYMEHGYKEGMCEPQSIEENGNVRCTAYAYGILYPDVLAEYLDILTRNDPNSWVLLGRLRDPTQAEEDFRQYVWGKYIGGSGIGCSPPNPLEQNSLQAPFKLGVKVFGVGLRYNFDFSPPFIPNSLR